MDRKFVTITRAAGQAWGINLKRADQKLVVDSVVMNGPSNILQKDDIIESINGLPANTIAASGVKPFFEGITTANIWYSRRVPIQPAPVINLLDDEGDDFVNNSSISMDYDDEEDNSPRRFMESPDDIFFNSRAAHVTPVVQRSGPSNIVRRNGNYPPVTPSRNQPVVIDLISSDDEETAAPTPARTAPPPPPPPPAAAGFDSATPRASGSNITQTLATSHSTNGTAVLSAESTSATTKTSARKVTPARSHIGKIKIKLEFEPKQFGEANIGDEVVEVMLEEASAPSPVELDGAGTGKRKFGEAFKENDDEIQILGGNMQVAADMPHPREACPRCPFQRFKEVTGNKTFCPNCYCFICEVKASECLEWKAHCHAHCKDSKWKKLRDTTNMPILRLMPPAEKAAFLAKYRSVMNAVEDGRYSDEDNDYDSWDEDDLYEYGYGRYLRNQDSSSASNQAFQDSVTGAKKVLSKLDINENEFLECTALLLNAVRLVTYARCDALTELCLSWISHPKFNQQFNDLLKQQLSRTNVSRLTWLSSLADLVVKSKLNPNSTSFQVPSELYQIDVKYFVKVIRKLADLLPLNQLKVMIDRNTGRDVILEVILEYFRTQDKALYPLVIEYMPKLNMENFRSTIKFDGYRCLDLLPQPILLLICEILDSNRLQKNGHSSSNNPSSTSSISLVNEKMISYLFSILLDIALLKVNLPEIKEIFHRIIHQSAISVLIQNPNLSVKTWAENRISTISKTPTEEKDELELVLIVTTIFLHECAKKINSFTQQDFDDVELTMKNLLPEASLKPPIILANICFAWSESFLCEIYDEAAFHLSCILAKNYFRIARGQSNYSVELIQSLHPAILHELSRIPSIKYLQQTNDILILQSFQIDLNVFRSTELKSNEILTQNSGSSSANATFVPMPLTPLEENQPLVYEYVSREGLIKDLLKPNESSLIRDSLKIIGHSLDVDVSDSLYNWLSTHYYSNKQAWQEFLLKFSGLFQISYKSILMELWKLSTTRKGTLHRIVKSRHFLDEIDFNELLVKFPTIAACRLLVRTRRLYSIDSNITEMVKFGKKECMEFQRVFTQNFAIGESQSTISRKGTEDLCKLFFMIYPIERSQRMNKILWDVVFKPFFNAVLSLQYEPSGSVNDMGILVLLENWTQAKKNIGWEAIYRLAEISVADLIWDEEELNVNMRMLHNLLEQELTKQYCPTAINNPNSVLAKLYELSNFSKVSTLVSEKAVMGFKVLSLYDFDTTSLFRDTEDLNNKKELLKRVKENLYLEIAKKGFSKSKAGYIMFCLVITLFFGQYDLSQHLLTQIPDNFSDSSIHHYFHHQVFQSESVPDYLAFVIFLNTPKQRLDDAIRVFIKILRPKFLQKLSPSSTKCFEPIMERCDLVLADSTVSPSNKSYIAELLFYYRYDEKSFREWIDFVRVYYDVANNRTIEMKQWLDQIQSLGIAEKSSKNAAAASAAARYSDSGYSETTSQERYRTFQHYSILFHLLPSAEYLHLLNKEFTEERTTIERFLEQNPKYLFSSGDSVGKNIYSECEKILLVALTKSETFLSKDALINIASQFYFNSILFLQHSTVVMRKQFVNALNERYYSAIETCSSSLINLDPFTKFCLSFLTAYRLIINEVSGVGSKENDNSSSSKGKNDAPIISLEHEPMDVENSESKKIINTGARLKVLFQDLLKKFPVYFKQYKNKMFNCFLFKENSASTFALLLENRVFELIPHYLQTLEKPFSSDSKVEAIENIDAVTNNLKFLFQCIQPHHFLPSDGPPALDMLPQYSKNVQEFLTNPHSLLLELFTYISEIQYRYFSLLNNTDSTRSSTFCLPTRAALKEVIVQFTKATKQFLGCDPLLSSFLDCFTDVFQNVKTFLGFYLPIKKESKASGNYDMILTTLFTLNKKRIFYFAMFDYVEMIFDLTVKFPELSKYVELFGNEEYRNHLLNNIFIYPLMTDIYESTWAGCPEKLLSEGLLSLKIEDETITKRNAAKLTEIASKYPDQAVASLGKGLLLYFIGFIPKELKQFHQFSFGELPSIQKVSLVGNSSSSAVAAPMRDDLKEERDEVDVMTRAEFYNVCGGRGYSEIIYSIDEEELKRFKTNRSGDSLIKLNPSLKLKEPPATSLLQQILRKKDSHIDYRGYYPRRSSSSSAAAAPTEPITDHPLVQVLRSILVTSASSKKGASGKAKAEENAKIVIQLMENFDVELFQKVVKNYYDDEEELLPYLLSLLFALFQKSLLNKRVSCGAMIKFAIYCYRTNNSLPSNLSTSSAAASAKPPSNFNRNLIQTIYKANITKLLNYFYRCYHSVLDSDPTTLSQVPIDQIIHIPEMIRMLTYTTLLDTSELTISGVSRRLPLYLMICKHINNNSRTIPNSFRETFLDLLLEAFQALVDYCKTNTMDKAKKSNLMTIIPGFKNCFRELSSTDSSLNNLVVKKKADFIKQLKAKKAVAILFEAL